MAELILKGDVSLNLDVNNVRQFTETERQNLNLNSEARHTHTNKAVLDEINGIDDTPTSGSNNLVTSGGVANAIAAGGGGGGDLSNYYTKTQTDELLENKVDKESGKGLSVLKDVSVDYYTDEEFGSMTELCFRTYTDIGIETASFYNPAQTNKRFYSKAEVDALLAGISPGGDIDLEEYVKNTDYATSTVGGVVKVQNYSHGLAIIAESGMLQIYPAEISEIDAKASFMKPIGVSSFDYAISKGTHQTMADDYDTSTLYVASKMSGKQGELPASYDAVKGYVDGITGDIETALDGKLANYSTTAEMQAYIEETLLGGAW